MNDSERHLIRFVCDGDMRNAQKAVKIILVTQLRTIKLHILELDKSDALQMNYYFTGFFQ